MRAAQPRRLDTARAAPASAWEYIPAVAHPATQPEEGVLAYVPVGQGAQAVAPAEDACVPGLHGAQVALDAAPCAAEEVPAGQGVGAPEPGVQ